MTHRRSVANIGRERNGKVSIIVSANRITEFACHDTKLTANRNLVNEPIRPEVV